MKPAFFLPLVALTACAATAAPPVPSLSPSRAPAEPVDTASHQETPAATISPAAPAVRVSYETAPDPIPGKTPLDGSLNQGGLVYGRTDPGAKVYLDEEEIMVDEEGRFLLGFGRDHPATAVLTVKYPDGRTDDETLTIAPQQWLESHITVAENKANPSAEYDLEKIVADKKLKDKARSKPQRTVYWDEGFVWPAEGCISSHFGYRRVINGSPRRYHSGVDVAAPDGMNPTDYIGTSVYAPADGIVTLAEPDMFFEGGLVFIDHGQQLESALMHMSEVLVKAGDHVSQGDLIGRVGKEGRATGPHLHWSLKWRDRLLDPAFNVPERPDCTD